MKGTYVLLIHVPFSLIIPVGDLGSIHFKAGYYAYVGSALGGLEHRISRHLREQKRVHWHIDYLLSRSRIVDVVFAETVDRKECAIANRLKERLSSVRGFGCSDCKCSSHLFYHPDLAHLTTEILNALKAEGLKPARWPSEPASATEG